MSDLEWSDEKPTKPGWYWFRCKTIRERIVKVWFSAGRGGMQHDYQWHPDRLENVQYAGPIEVPEETTMK